MSQTLLQSSPQSLPPDVAEAAPAFWSERARLERLEAMIGAPAMAQSALARCLPALLLALDWRGAERHLAPWLPVAGQPLTLPLLGQLLTGLGFEVGRQRSVVLSAALPELSAGCLLLFGQECRVYLGDVNGVHYWHDGQHVQALGTELPERASLLVIRPDRHFQPVDAPQPDWSGQQVYRVRHLLAGLAASSLVVNLLALAVSLFTMVVYNRVIPSGSISTLWALGAGAVLAVLGAWWLRLSRAHTFAELSAWAGAEIGPTVLRKTLGLPLEMSGRLGPNNNLNRLRSMENVRQYLGGSAAGMLADMPFVLVFLLVIAFLGGWIVLIPVVGLIFYALASMLLAPVVERRAAESGRELNRLTEQYTNLVQQLRGLQGIAGRQHWLRRVHSTVVEAAAANRRLAQVQGLVQSLAYALSNLLVLATLAGGIALVLTQTMSTGGLIAAMMLIWRVTAPAQQFFSMRLNLQQMADSRRQLERLMQSTGELQDARKLAPLEPHALPMQAERLFYRHSAEQEAAMNGVSFSLEPGQRVVVVGPNGAGKSTLLECLAGLRYAQSGQLRYGGRDIRQFDPADYRAGVGYLPQFPTVLPLAVGDYLRLSHPLATPDRMVALLAQLGGADWWRHFDADSAAAALATVLDPWREDTAALHQRYLVGLVDALLDEPALLVLDDPLRDADAGLAPLLDALLESLHGHTTVVIATHRADLIQRADAIVILDRGNLVHAGPVARQPDAPATATGTSS